MVASLTYRTDDNSRWGGGQGSNLAAVTIDLNFWTLFQAIENLETSQANGAGIDFISQPAGGDLFYVHLTDHRVLGPFTIPTAQWQPRGEWAPLTSYAAFDVVSHNGSTYLIPIAHTSASTFSPFATDGLGHNLYVLVLSSPANSLPDAGTIHQRLVKASGSPFKTAWISDLIRLHVFIAGQPLPNELLIQYPCVDHMILPVGLVGTSVFQGTGVAAPCSYTLSKNGAAIGSIDFSGPSPETISVTFSSSVACVPGDVITLNAPAIPDVNQANVSFTVVAQLA